MFYIVGISITFFLVLILISKKNKADADKILAFWLTVTGLHLILYFLFITNKYVSFPYLLGFEIPIPLLHGPFLFLYTTALTNHANFKKVHFLHFIPFVITLIFLYPFLALSPASKIKVYQNGGKEYEFLISFIYVTILISGVFYSAFSFYKLLLYRQTIKEQFSFTEKINLKWLLYLIAGLSIIWLCVIFGNDKYIFSAVVFYVIFIGYFGIKQVGVFTNENSEAVTKEKLLISEIPIISDTLNTSIVLEKPVQKIKYEKSNISNEDIRVIHQNLTLLMENKKAYKNPELTLSNLAQKLDVHPNTLSQVINSVEQKNFYDYINFHRVEEFKRLISSKESQKFTLLSLGFECGFSSKTSLNRNFKKITGLSPTEFLNQINIKS